MNLKKTMTTAMPLLWVFFLSIDFLTRMLSGITVLRKLRPFVVMTRGVQNVKRLSVFALIIMNVFLAWNWINQRPDRSES